VIASHQLGVVQIDSIARFCLEHRLLVNLHRPLGRDVTYAITTIRVEPQSRFAKLLHLDTKLGSIFSLHLTSASIVHPCFQPFVFLVAPLLSVKHSAGAPIECRIVVLTSYFDPTATLGPTQLPMADRYGIA